MNPLGILFALILVLVVGTPQQGRNPRFRYTYQKFVVTWPESFCQTKPCRYGYNSWDK